MNFTINNISFIISNSLDALRSQFNVIADRNKFDTYLEEVGLDLTESDKLNITKKIDSLILKENKERINSKNVFEYETEYGEKFQIEL